MKDKIIIVEGPQGVGKTTFTNLLREKMKATDLYRLSGIKDKTESGHAKIKLKYEKLLEYMENCEDINMIFDRTFFTNEVYSRLGYQNYDFSSTYNELLVILYLQDEELYAQRIKRDKHEYQKFDVQSSIMQQREYLKLAEEVENQTKNIKIIRFKNDTPELQEENLNKYF